MVANSFRILIMFVTPNFEAECDFCNKKCGPFQWEWYGMTSVRTCKSSKCRQEAHQGWQDCYDDIVRQRKADEEEYGY